MILKYLKLLKFALLDKISIKIIKLIAVLIKLSTSSTSYIPSLLLRETHSNTNPFSRVYSSAIDLRRSKTAPRTAPTTAKEKDRPKLAVKSSKKWESEKRARRLRLSRLSLSLPSVFLTFSLSLSLFPAFALEARNSRNLKSGASALLNLHAGSVWTRVFTRELGRWLLSLSLSFGTGETISPSAHVCVYLWRGRDEVESVGFGFRPYAVVPAVDVHEVYRALWQVGWWWYAVKVFGRFRFAARCFFFFRGGSCGDRFFVYTLGIFGRRFVLVERCIKESCTLNR